ncbi:hypothetical protein ACET3Z_011291 [Daucus carota]
MHFWKFRREKVIIPASKHIFNLIGNQNAANQTMITWDDKASDIAKDGTVLTSRHLMISFCHCPIRLLLGGWDHFRGSTGMQAIALRIAGDKAVFYGVRIVGTQDTLLDDTGSNYFYQSYIEGTADFIFGRARSLYKKNSDFVQNWEFVDMRRQILDLFVIRIDPHHQAVSQHTTIDLHKRPESVQARPKIQVFKTGSGLKVEPELHRRGSNLQARHRN